MATILYSHIYHKPHVFANVDEPKPCPFCGQTDKLTITAESDFNEIYANTGSATISLTCHNCGLDFYEHEYSGSNYERKVMILINKWNERKGENA